MFFFSLFQNLAVKLTTLKIPSLLEFFEILVEVVFIKEIKDYQAKSLRLNFRSLIFFFYCLLIANILLGLTMPKGLKIITFLRFKDRNSTVQQYELFQLWSVGSNCQTCNRFVLFPPSESFNHVNIAEKTGCVTVYQKVL